VTGAVAPRDDPAAERVPAPTTASVGTRQTSGIRGRLVRLMLVAVGVAVLLLGLPLAVVARQWVYSQEITALAQRAEQLAEELDVAGDPEELASAVAMVGRVLDARVTVLDVRGRVVRDSSGVAPGTVFDDRPVRETRAGSPAGELIGDALVVAVVTRVNVTPVIVRVAAPADTAAARVTSAWFVIVVLGATALTVGAALASWRARQLARPLEAVADAARRLGEGDFGGRAVRSDIAEIDRIAASLDATATRLRTALERSASLSADASHQLRTPLTALRLNLEALAAELDTPSDSLTAADAEVDRLEATLDELLALADAGARAAVVDLRALTMERLDAWRTIAYAAGRAVRVTRTGVPLVRVRPAAIGQALQVLLDNALTHGRGDVTVWLEPVRRGERTWVRLCVGDEGPGPTAGDVADGGGRGLPLARALIEAEGGRLVLDSDHSPTPAASPPEGRSTSSTGPAHAGQGRSTTASAHRRGSRVCLVVPAVDDVGAEAVEDPAP
jgi:signal transduction histidine kinase